MPPAQGRVAPTQKISDDAPMSLPPTGTAPPAPYLPAASIPPQNMPVAAPFSVPPQNLDPISISNGTPAPIPGYGYGAPPPSAPIRGSTPSMAPRASASRAPAPAPSLSMPVRARRPWGLIFVVLAIDLALAGTGGWLLSQGLAAASPPPSSGAK
ncbi:MAG TPA: hypothetical protein VGM88_32655 [Kofleriaceae bacterium]